MSLQEFHILSVCDFFFPSQRRKRQQTSHSAHRLSPHSHLFWSHSSGRVKLSHQRKRWHNPCRDEAILNWWNHLKSRKNGGGEIILCCFFFIVSKWSSQEAHDAYRSLILSFLGNNEAFLGCFPVQLFIYVTLTCVSVTTSKAIST